MAPSVPSQQQPSWSESMFLNSKLETPSPPSSRCCVSGSYSSRRDSRNTIYPQWRKSKTQGTSISYLRLHPPSPCMPLNTSRPPPDLACPQMFSTSIWMTLQVMPSPMVHRPFHLRSTISISVNEKSNALFLELAAALSPCLRFVQKLELDDATFDFRLPLPSQELLSTTRQTLQWFWSN